jgi:hypothetical protein
MSAAQALRAARAAGIKLDIDGDDLLWAAPEQPSTAVLALLARHKAGIVRLLRSGDDKWSAEDWQAFFDERAGIAEYDGGRSRQEAEALAFEHCVVNGLCATRFDQCLAAVFAVVAVTSTQASCCRSAPKPLGTPGFIRIVGQHGTPSARRTPSPTSQRRGSRRP